MKKKLSADDFRDLNRRLCEHSVQLAKSIREHVAAMREEPNFDDAVDLRDLAQNLTSALYVLENIDLIIETAERDGPRQCHFNLSDCGLEE